MLAAPLGSFYQGLKKRKLTAKIKALALEQFTENISKID